MGILRPQRFAALAAIPLAAFCIAGNLFAQPANGGQSISSQSQKVVDPPAAKTVEPTASAHPIQVADTYRIGIGDQLLIAVWHERDLSLSVVVRPDGVITIPLLNDLYVVGQTPKELGASITEKLKPFVNEPQVTVSVSSIQSRKVYLVGQAARQGAFPLNEKKTVLELITEAGGLGQFAKGGSIYVLRVVDGKDVRIPFNYKKVVSGKNPDVDLLPGDRIIVP